MKPDEQLIKRIAYALAKAYAKGWKAHQDEKILILLAKEWADANWESFIDEAVTVITGK